MPRLMILIMWWMLASASASWAQVVYGVGDQAGGGTTFNRLFSVNPASGAATNLCGLSFQSAANAVSPMNGLVYYFEYSVSSPRMNTINPLTCANGTAVSTTLPSDTIRATFCPDGRLYASSNTSQFYEVDRVTGATVRTLNWSGLPTGGSGDFACVNNGDLYIVAYPGSGAYRLYRASGASVASTASGGTVTVVNIGSLGSSGTTPNGLTEVSSTVTGCAAAQPCLIASTGASNETWGVDVTSGDADDIGTTGHTLTDLSRSYPVDLSISKSATPTVVLQGQTVVYRLDVSNLGPGLVEGGTVTDVLSPTTFGTVSWTCSVLTAGTPTVLATGCGTAAGTGSVNHTVTLSLGGAVRFVITAVLQPDFTGVVSNVGRATVTALVTDPDLSNNTTSTASNTVTPAAHLDVQKSNATDQLAAGSTTTYTVTVINNGPADADDAVLRDLPPDGLACTSVSCAGASGGASCPEPAELTMDNLTGDGVVIEDLPADSSVTFSITCGVTATGR